MTKEALLQAGVLVVCALIIYLIGSNDELFLGALSPPVQFLVVTGLGVSFHWVRFKFRPAFGGIELYIGVFAIGSFTFGLHNIASPHDEFLAELIGSVYLVGRGLENIANYRGKDPLLQRAAALLTVRAYGT